MSTGHARACPGSSTLLEKQNIKMTSFIIGDAVRRHHPGVAAEIVRRGHEAGAQGRSWQRQYHLPRPQKKVWIADSVQAIEQATGARPVGYNKYWIRPGMNTLEILVEIGFSYHIDDPSADEPFLQMINCQPFAAVPYSVRLNDIASFDFPGFNPVSYEQQMIDEFDQLLTAIRRRRATPPDDGHRPCTSASAATPPGFASWTGYSTGGASTRMWWARKDQIAQWALDHRDASAWVDRDPAPAGGLPGRSA